MTTCHPVCTFESQQKLKIDSLDIHFLPTGGTLLQNVCWIVLVFLLFDFFIKNNLKNLADFFPMCFS